MNTENLGKPIEILLVDDNAGDARLALESLKESKIRNTLNWVQDGVEAMAFLRRHGKYATAPRPDLILLDLNMPKMDGREVLKKMKSNDAYRKIPVIVFSTTKNQLEVKRCYDLGANTYIVKPVSYDTLVETIREICTYWFNTATLIDVH